MQTKKQYLRLHYFLLFCLCIPDNTKYPGIMKIALNGLQVVAFSFAIIMLFAYKYYKSKELLPVLLWFGWMILSTLINGTDLVSTFKLVMPLFAVSILSYYVFKKNIADAFDIIAWFFTFLIIIQALSYVTHLFGYIFSQGKWRTYYFFGIRVRFNKIVPFAVFFCLVSWKYGKKQSSIPLIVSTLCGLYFSIGEKLSTSLVCYGIILIVIIAMKIVRSEHMWRNMSLFALGLVAVFVFIYVGRSQVFQWLFVDLLGEDVTLSERTLIWAQAVENMKGLHWIIGNGYGHDYYFRLRSSFIVQVAHNQYLELIFDFGIIGLLLYFIMCKVQFSRVIGKTDKQLSKYFIATFLAMIVMQIPATTFEKPYYYVYFMSTMFLSALSSIPKTRKKRLLHI